MLLSEAVELTPDLSERAWEEWGLDAEDRANVVVFLDWFDDWIFHTEPGERHFGWMFPD